MDIQAQAKYIKVSPRKMLLLVKSVKTTAPGAAVVQLKFINKSGAEELAKVIGSALANGKNTANFDLEHAQFKAIEVLSGPAMKRFRPVSRGMAHAYKKRMTHVKVILTDAKQVKSDLKIKEEKKKN